jgi:hypothetical protein
MADYAYLVGRRQPVASFRRDDADEEIAYACDWVPIAWLALFEPEDTLSVAEPLEARVAEKQAPYPQVRALNLPADPKRSCATLLRERKAALASYSRRRGRLERILPADLVPQLRALEMAVESALSPYIQVLVTDLDLYVSFDDSEERLRGLIATMDSDEPGRWRALLSHVQAQMGSGLSQVRYPKGAEIPAVVGYLPEKSSPPYPGAAPRQAGPAGTESGSMVFTRSTTGGEGWRAYVDPRYVKILAVVLLAAIFLAVVSTT